MSTTPDVSSVPTPSFTASPAPNITKEKKVKKLVTTSPAITTSTTPTNVPEGYQYFSEGSANILYKDKNAVFYNPVQEFNRDMSIMMIKLFQDLRESEGKGRKIKVLEALTATGLRSVRYAKEIPDIEMILSNDIDEAAVESIRKNAEFNGVTNIIHPNQGDASLVMMQNRANKFDVVDLDPYGSPSQFLDSAVQCIADGGLLCVTATDMAVLCGSYPSTCYTKYGSLPVKGKHCHEMAVRILMYCVSVHAARYKKYVVPLLAISVDFYCRIFFRVYTGAGESNAAICKYSHFYQCSGCESFQTQVMGKQTTGGNFNANFAPVVPQECPNCKRKYQMAGPIWSDPMHDKALLQRALKHLEENPTLYNTSKRLYGLLTVMHEELEQPLFMTMPHMCNVLHVNQPSLAAFRSAVVAQGYKVSISHTEGSAIKTDAPQEIIWDIMRSWYKLQGKKLPSENTPAFNILSQDPKVIADFTVTKEGEIPTRDVPRFLPNPKENWGPGARATGTNKSRTGEHITLAEKRAINQNKKAKKTVCQNFQKGSCKHGENCRYLHTTAAEIETEKGEKDTNNNNNT